MHKNLYYIVGIFHLFQKRGCFIIIIRYVVKCEKRSILVTSRTGCRHRYYPLTYSCRNSVGGRRCRVPLCTGRALTSIWSVVCTFVLVAFVPRGAGAQRLGAALPRGAQPARAPAHLLQQLVPLVAAVQPARRAAADVAEGTPLQYKQNVCRPILERKGRFPTSQTVKRANTKHHYR